MAFGKVMRQDANKLLIRGALVAIAIVTIVAYYPGMSAGFYFDDEPNFSLAPAFHWTEISMEALGRTLNEAWSKSRPVANISLAVTHRFSGLDPAPYHWTNLLIHLAVGIALFWVVRLLQLRHTNERGSAWLAICVVLLFLVHPINIQSVTYVVQRMTSMSTLFFLLAFGCYITARFQPVMAKRYKYFAATIFFFLLSIGSKEVGLLLLQLLVLYEYCFNRNEWHDNLWARRSSRDRILLVAGCTLLMAIATVAIWKLVDVRIYWHETMPRRDFSGFERVLTQGRVQFFYLSLLLWPAPSRLNLDHDFVVSRAFLEPVTTMFALVGWLVILVFAMRNISTRPRLAFPILAYLLLHSVESAPISLELVFEHRMYLPLTMLAVLIAINLAPLLNKRRQLGYTAIILIALGLAGATYQRNVVWGDPVAFLQDTAEKSPQKFRPQYNLGTKLGQRGMLPEARAALERAIELRPEHSEAHNQLANVYMLAQMKSMAEKHYRQAIEHNPENAEALFNLATILASQQRFTEQRKMLEQFVKVAPPNLEKQKQWAIEYLER